MKPPHPRVLVFLRPEMEDILTAANALTAVADHEWLQNYAEYGHNIYTRYDELERWHRELGRRLEALRAKITRMNDCELARMNAPETNGYEGYEDDVDLEPPHIDRMERD